MSPLNLQILTSQIENFVRNTTDNNNYSNSKPDVEEAAPYQKQGDFRIYRNLQEIRN